MRILVIEDEAKTAKFLKKGLTEYQETIHLPDGANRPTAPPIKYQVRTPLISLGVCFGGEFVVLRTGGPYEAQVRVAERKYRVNCVNPGAKGTSTHRRRRQWD